MVAIHGRSLLSRAVSILRRHCNRYFTNISHARGRPTILGPSSSFTHGNLNTPFPAVVSIPPKRFQAQVAPNAQIPRVRKLGRVKSKGYFDLAKNTSTNLVPGGFRLDPVKKQILRKASKNKHRGRKHRKHDYETDDDAQSDQDQDERLASEHEAFVRTQFESLMFDKARREGEFEVKEVSERVKREAVERKARMRWETTEAERLRKMEELEKREEKERADRWKDQRLAQLEREKAVAVTELAREKAERKHSRLRWVFKDQQQRQKDEAHWKRLREREAMLLTNLQVTDNAFKRACNERDHVVQEIEEEKAKRLRVEESLRRWKESMKQYFPGGQQGPDQQQEQPQQQHQELPQPRQLLPLEEQFKLYEKKWEVLRSGVDIDGTKVHLISFSQIPWPVINMTLTDPSQILPEHIREFVLHPLRDKLNAGGKRRSKKRKATDELLKWHSDRFTPAVLSKVREEDKAAATAAAGEVAKVLTSLIEG